MKATKRNNFNFLIACPSPRDIKEVQQALDKIDFIDKYIVKYTRPESVAYRQIQHFFCSHNYDYLILWADDLIASEQDIRQLLADCEELRPDVISGVCNVDTDTQADCMAISTKPFDPAKRGDRFRYFEKFGNYYDEKGILLPKYQEKPIIKTRWQGFPLTCMSRRLFSFFDLTADSSGFCMDDVFSWNCIQNEIPMWTDLRINMKHLKISDHNTTMLLTKDKEPYTKFIEKNKGV